MSAVLLVRLKITDLTAWTALAMGRRLLGSGLALEKLVREQVTLFEPEPGARAEQFEERLGEAVRRSNFFVNPNKESYRFLTSADRGDAWRPPEGAWGILARPREDTRDEGLRERLLLEHPMRGLGAIRRAKAWLLWTKGPNGSPEVDRCFEILGNLRDQKRGLLVNPHSECALLVRDGVSWASVERFLIEPAAAVRSAA